MSQRKVLPEKPTVDQLLSQFPLFYRTRVLHDTTYTPSTVYEILMWLIKNVTARGMGEVSNDRFYKYFRTHSLHKKKVRTTTIHHLKTPEVH